MEKNIYIYFYLRGYFKTGSVCVELEDAGNETVEGNVLLFSTSDILTVMSFSFISVTHCSVVQPLCYTLISGPSPAILTLWQ